MERRLLLVFLVALIVRPVTSETAPKRLSWPAVAAQQHSYSFRDASKARLSMTIRSRTGRPLYLLQCANTDLSGEGEVMPGDFACWLKATDPGIVSRIGPENLLSPTPFGGSRFDDSGDDVHDRESVWVWQLIGKCGDYPDFGRQRVFRLRGMKLTMVFRNVQTSLDDDNVYPALKSFDLSVSVHGDETAISSIAAPSPFDAFGSPESDPHGCESVKTNTEERVQVPSHYPAIRKTEFSFKFPVDAPAPNGSNNSDNPVWTRSILGEDGRAAYEFSCLDDGTPVSSTATVIPGPRYAKEGIGIVNSGIWCRLLEPGTKGPNLLDLTPDPYSRTSRAEVFPDQLRGACADYPEWGNQRSFRLHGMKVTMFMDEIKFGRTEVDLAGFPSPDLIGVKIHVTVAPDPLATSPAPEQVKYADWSLVPTTCHRPILNPLAVTPSP